MSSGAREPTEDEAGRTPSSESAAAANPTRGRRDLQGRAGAADASDLVETKGGSALQ